MAMGSSPTINRKINYTFEMVDNVAPVAKKGAEESKKEAKAVEETTQAIDHQNITYIKTVASMGAFRHGMHSMALGMRDLWGITRDTNKNFYNMIAAIDLVVGAAMAFKGIIGIMQVLRDSEIALAGVEVFRKVLHNPAGVAAVALGLGAAGFAVGYLYSQSQQTVNQSTSNNTNVYQTVTFRSEPTYAGRSATRESLGGMGF